MNNPGNACLTAIRARFSVPGMFVRIFHYYVATLKHGSMALWKRLEQTVSRLGQLHWNHDATPTPAILCVGVPAFHLNPSA